MNIYRLLQRENRGRERKEMKIEKFAPFFIQDSHNRICESGLSGQRHVGDFVDVDGLQHVSDFTDVDGL
jgi:hypothetical protein